MSKLSTTLAMLGAVSALGVAALPLSSYAVTKNVTVQAEVPDAISIAVSSEGNFDGTTLDLGNVKPGGNAEGSLTVKVSGNTDSYSLNVKAKSSANMVGASSNSNTINATSNYGSLEDESGWAFKTDGAITNWTAMTTNDQELTTADTGTAIATPIKVTFGVSVASDQAPDVYSVDLIFTATAK